MRYVCELGIMAYVVDERDIGSRMNLGVYAHW